MEEHETIKRSLFDSPVDLYHFSQIRPPSSRSMPASRRNSSDDPTLDVLLGAKLSLNENESRHLPFAISTQDASLNPKEVPSLHSLLSHPPEYLTPKETNRINSVSSHNDEYPELFPLDPLMHTPRKESQTHWQPITTIPSLLTSKRAPDWPTHRRITTTMTCPHYQQFGFCTQYDCLFQHPSPYPPPHLTISTYQPPSLYQQYLSSPAASQPLSRPKRQQDRLMHANVQDFVGKLDELCKDQNGCRFLQKKIEDPEQLDFVFKEIHGHFNELMIDPFGNYICQKIIEYGNDEQRDDIVKTVANNLAKIALNVHGTRAVQKLIECFSTPEQIQTAVSALTPHVVTLIKDLNGNHVIQKCLHSLHTPHNQFIYDAVCQHCIEVASHKHGCCVLQRCFDYATVLQKDQLVYEISQHALVLVQDAFGNYVVQYVLELGVLSYSENIIRQFVNHVCLLSVQKFSSNVIENCIRTAQPKTRRLLIAELVNPTVMQHLLQDSFANYVIQTSLDFADSDQRAELVACIRPLLPTIRSTPYGKRIYSRIIKDSKSHFHQIM